MGVNYSCLFATGLLGGNHTSDKYRMVPPFLCITMKIKLFLLLFLLSVATTIFAESIMIKQKSGNETILDLSTNPIITFSGENMVVTNDYTSITLSLDDIDSYMVGNTSGIQEVTVAPHFRDGHIVFTGFKKRASVFIYSIDGKMVGKIISDDTGIIDINIGNLPKGAYVISTPNNKIKVINK